MPCIVPNIAETINTCAMKKKEIKKKASDLGLRMRGGSGEQKVEQIKVNNACKNSQCHIRRNLSRILTYLFNTYCYM